MSSRKTHEQFVDQLKKINPHIVVLGKYQTTKDKIKVRCENGHEWEAYPVNLLKGRGCKICGHIKRAAERQKTHEQYLKDLQDKNIFIYPIEEYKGTMVKIKHCCPNHDVIWEVSPNNVLHGFGCPKCRSEKVSVSRALTHQDYLNKLAERNIPIVPLEEYKKAKIKISHECQICGYVWDVAPDNVLSCSCCPECSNQKLREERCLGNEKYNSLLRDRNSSVRCIGIYKNNRTPVLHLCDECKYEWEAPPSSVLNRLHGHECPCCYPASLGEKRIIDYLRLNRYTFRTQERFEGLVGEKDSKLMIDIYLPEQKIAIEFHGKQHEKAIDYFDGVQGYKQRILHDKIKEEYMAEHGIKYIVIWYNEIDKIESILSRELNQ